MTVILEITPDLQRVLEDKARRRGLELDAYLLDLAARDATPENEAEAQAEGDEMADWMRAFNVWVDSHPRRVSLPPDAFARASFYAETT